MGGLRAMTERYWWKILNELKPLHFQFVRHADLRKNFRAEEWLTFLYKQLFSKKVMGSKRRFVHLWKFPRLLTLPNLRVLRKFHVQRVF